MGRAATGASLTRPSRHRITAPRRARLVHAVLNDGKTTNSLSVKDRQDLAILMRAGVLQPQRNTITVTDDVTRSLFPEGSPQHNSDSDR